MTRILAVSVLWEEEERGEKREEGRSWTMATSDFGA